MGRLLGPLLCAVTALVAVGCAPEGSYRVTWGFLGDGEEEPASWGCGAHGVDAIRILAVSEGGGGHELIAACASGEAIGSLTPGTWLFGIHALGVSGRYKEPLDEADPLSTTILHAWQADKTVPEGGRAELDHVVFLPQPACRDDVDNDRDGRVDTDDPDCPDPDGETESAPPPLP